MNIYDTLEKKVLLHNGYIRLKKPLHVILTRFADRKETDIKAIVSVATDKRQTANHIGGFSATLFALDNELNAYNVWDCLRLEDIKRLTDLDLLGGGA